MAVIGISAVGVVMMAALLILPTAAARLWTDRFGKRSSAFYALGLPDIAGGTAFAMQFQRLPPGPIIILTGAALFFASLFLAPHHGVIARVMKQRQFGSRVGNRPHYVTASRGTLPTDWTLPFDDDILCDSVANEKPKFVGNYPPSRAI